LYTARTRMQGIEPEIAQDFSLLIKDSNA